MRDHATVEQELGDAFAGATGDVLDARFLKDEVHGSWRLDLGGLRWFWRSALLTAVAAPWDRYWPHFLDAPPALGLIHSAAYALRPEPCGVLQGRGSSDVIRMREQLAPAERLAIAHFLELLLESPHFARTNLAQLAAQAILWCWRDDPDTVEAAQRYRRVVRSYQRPTAEDPADEALIVQIEQAFADTPAPTGAPATMVTIVDDETASYVLELTGTAWPTLVPWFYDMNAFSFSFMTADAFRYFIPGVLRDKLGPGSNADPEFHLVSCMVRPSSFRDRSLAMAGAFSPIERAAVAAYLRERTYSGNRAEVEEALRTVWEVDR